MNTKYLITWERRHAKICYSKRNAIDHLDYTLNYSSRLAVHLYRFNEDGTLAFIATVRHGDLRNLESIVK